MAVVRPMAAWGLCLLLLASWQGGASAQLGLSIIKNLGRKCIMNDNSTSFKCDAGFTCIPCLQKTNVQVVEDPSKECEIGVEGECTPCFQGDYCPQGSVNPLVWTFMHVCPAGSYCPNATHREDCNEGYFCPSGAFSYNENLTTVDISCPEGLGLYCPEGSKSPLNACPAGFYCPHPGAKIECPKDHFCRSFSISPQNCPAGSFCPKGSKYPGVSWAGLLTAFLALVLVFPLLYLSAQNYYKEGEEREKRQMKAFQKESGSTQKIMAKLLGVPIYSLPQKVPGIKTKSVPITIEFIKLGLDVEGRTILKSVTATFFDSQLTAIMGPSGCGKSSLLNTVSGRAAYGTMTGQVLINGVEKPMKSIAKVMAFVPQDDTVFAELTVRENLRFSSLTRLGVEVTEDARQQFVTGCVNLLGLDHIQHTVVGDVEKRGISGGQKKRVSIGMELVADPTVIFLDEPTSGLSATDTLIVMKALRSMAYVRRTVVAVIHQPRYEVFTLFHEVLLLGKGGQVVFFGDSSASLEYFTDLGFALPNYANPADFILDIIAGNATRATDSEPFDPTELFPLWEENKHKVQEAEFTSDSKQIRLPNDMMDRILREWKHVDKDESGAIDASELQPFLMDLGVPTSAEEAKDLLEVLDADNSGELELTEFVDCATREYALLKYNVRAEAEEEEEDLADGGGDLTRSKSQLDILTRSGKERDANLRKKALAAERRGERLTRSRLNQFTVFLRRARVQFFHTLTSNQAFDCAIMLAAGIIVGAITGNDWEYQDVPTDTLLSGVTIGVLTTVSSLKTLGSERVMTAREKQSGISMLSFFLAKCAIDLLNNLVFPSIYAGVYYSFWMPDMKFFTYWGITVLMAWATQGAGILISVLFRPGTAMLVGVLFPLITGVFLGGVEPRLSTFTDGSLVIAGISFTRWGVEAMTIAEMRVQDEYQSERINLIIDAFGFDDHHLGINLLALGVMGLLYRTLAYIQLIGGFEVFFKALMYELVAIFDGQSVDTTRPPQLPKGISKKEITAPGGTANPVYARASDVEAPASPGTPGGSMAGQALVVPRPGERASMGGRYMVAKSDVNDLMKRSSLGVPRVSFTGAKAGVGSHVLPPPSSGASSTTQM